ncbi:MAG TPA: secretin N-terminal domain-containing protein [Thermoanaerobaculia bacterium]|nr:secretin N-terminal domain-containing protein [Thermoanaerobaculia bacterium]
MNQLKSYLLIALLMPLLSCTSYRAFNKAHDLETAKNWDQAVAEYTKALEIDPNNVRYKVALQRARNEAARAHFEKGKSLRAAGHNELAATELELAARLDPTNQYAAVEFAKAVAAIQEASRVADTNSVDAMKKRSRVTKAQPPQLNPASSEPISLTFPRETPVKDIYRALGNAFGINILFDQAIKDDRISIELHDVTAQTALERVMQAANHFYKVLDEKTIIVVPDNPQARRDYEDLVIQTFYLSNGDADQVINVVRTMIEARNVFPLKALNAITIRDTADKVRIAQKIIEANDKARAEVVVEVELLQLDASKAREIGLQLLAASGSGNYSPGGAVIQFDEKGLPVAAPSLPISAIRALTSDNLSFTIPSFTYGFLKTNVDAQLLARPELRISEGEKATLHIGQKIPLPVSTFTSAAPGSGSTFQPVTSYNYTDIGIKIAMEPRVHHNREVTLKLTVEVSSFNGFSPGSSPPQPIIGTRTIESTIRLKDGETNFLAGLIRREDSVSRNTTPFLGDFPILGRLFSRDNSTGASTDLVLTMTPHIVRIADITEDDLAPMWVGTNNNLTFRGISPRIESQSGIDPFNSRQSSEGEQFRDRESGIAPAPPTTLSPGAPPISVTPGSAPRDPFSTPPPLTPVDPPPTNPNVSQLSPRISPQPINLALKPGQEAMWDVVAIDLDGLTAKELVLHYNPVAISVGEVLLGKALDINPETPPIVRLDQTTGTIRLTSSDGKGLKFKTGGEVMTLRVRGGASGETYLVVENPNFTGASGVRVDAAVAGGRAKVD